MPFLFDIKRSDVNGPILQFQSTVLDKEDLRKLIHSLNGVDTESNLPDTRLDNIFEVWWPQLENSLKAVPSFKPADQSIDDAKSEIQKVPLMLEEILELSRQQSRLFALQERQIFEIVNDSLAKIELNRDGLDHPSVRDLIEAYSLIVEVLEASDQSDVPTEIKNKMKAKMETAIHAIQFIRMNQRKGDIGYNRNRGLLSRTLKD